MENRQGEDKNSIGNVEVKELICTTHGHELREGEMWEKVQGIRSILGRHNVDRGRLRIV